MKKSTLAWIIIILLALAVLYFFAFTSKEENENTVKTGTNAISNEQENINQNEQINEALENEIDKTIENEIAENEVENTTSSETFEEEPKTAEEKAIAIAKKDWGDTNNANFSIQGIDGNGNYIIAVSDNETTVLAFYTVNVNDQTFKKREMN